MWKPMSNWFAGLVSSLWWHKPIFVTRDFSPFHFWVFLNVTWWWSRCFFFTTLSPEPCHFVSGLSAGGHKSILRLLLGSYQWHYPESVSVAFTRLIKEVARFHQVGQFCGTYCGRYLNSLCIELSVLTSFLQSWPLMTLGDNAESFRNTIYI